MAGTSQSLHEAESRLNEETLDRHRAIASLMEELEAVDWYDQRVVATNDAELARVLAHNRDEEKEHAMMTLEWLRRRDPQLDAHMRTYLFTDGEITAIEDEATASATAGVAHSAGTVGSGAGSAGSLGIGSLRASGSGT